MGFALMVNRTLEQKYLEEQLQKNAKKDAWVKTLVLHSYLILQTFATSPLIMKRYLNGLLQAICNILATKKLSPQNMRNNGRGCATMDNRVKHTLQE